MAEQTAEKKKKPEDKDKPKSSLETMLTEPSTQKGWLEDSMDRMAEEDLPVLAALQKEQELGETVKEATKVLGEDQLDTPKMDVETAIRNAYQTGMEEYIKVLDSDRAKRAGIMGDIGNILATAGAAFGLPGLMVGGSRLSNSAAATMQQLTLPAAKFMNTTLAETLSGAQRNEQAELLLGMKADLTKQGQEAVNIAKSPLTDAQINSYKEQYKAAGAAEWEVNILDTALRNLAVPTDVRGQLEEDVAATANARTISGVANIMRDVLDPESVDTDKIELRELKDRNPVEFMRKAKEYLLEQDELAVDRYNLTDATMEEGINEVIKETTITGNPEEQAFIGLFGLSGVDLSAKPIWHGRELQQAKERILILEGVNENDTYGVILRKIKDNLKKRMRPRSTDGGYQVFADILTMPVPFGEPGRGQYQDKRTTTQIFSETFKKKPGPFGMDALFEQGLADLAAKGPMKATIFSHQFINTMGLLTEYQKGVFD